MRPAGPRLRSIHSRTTGSATFQMSSFGSKLRATPSTTTMVFCSRISSGRVRMSNRPVTSSSSVNSFGIEMHFGDAAIVARDEAEENFGKEAPLLQAEPAHDAEIDGDQAAGIVEEQIAGVHVGMKE